MKRLILKTSFFTILVLLSLASPSFTNPLPDTKDIAIQQGEDFHQPFRLNSCQVWNSAQTSCLQKQPMSLVGYQFKAQARRDATAPVFANFSTTISSGGMVTISLSRAYTTTLVKKAGIWDLLMIEPNGAQSFVLRGVCTVMPSATH